MIVGEGFINHQEHDAGEEGQGQDDQNRHLKRGQTPVSMCAEVIKSEDVAYICERGLGLGKMAHAQKCVSSCV